MGQGYTVKLFFKLIDNNRLRLFVLLITTCIVSFLSISFFNELLPVFENHRAFIRAGLVDRLIVWLDDTAINEHDRNKVNDIISEVNALDEVNSLSTFVPREIVLFDKKTNLTFTCDIYEQHYNENYQFDLVEGRLPEKGTNEVLISEDGKSVYGIGDTIYTEVLYIEKHYTTDGDIDYFERKYSQPAELTVVGILKNDSNIMSPYDCDSPIGVFGRKANESSGTESPLIISYGCRDVNGNTLAHDYGNFFELQVLIVELNEGHSVSEAKEHINMLLHGYGNVNTGYEIIESDIKYNWDVFRPYAVYGSAVLFLMIITMISMYVFQIKQGMKALISYYICGSSWKTIVLKICLVNISVTVLGIVCGLLLVKINYAPFADFVLVKSAVLITLIIVLLIQCITSLIFFLGVNKVSPIDIKRREDE